jgi:hypothetical protein
MQRLYVEEKKEFNAIDSFLFQRFSASVANEVLKNNRKIKDYEDLIQSINFLTFSRPKNEVNDIGKTILVKLFPPGLLPAYKILFGNFMGFSARMNTWVTHFTTPWLMGKSTVLDLATPTSTDEISSSNSSSTFSTQTIFKDQLLIVEKCKFLETSNCIQTCLHACKIPTERFFLEEMGLPVTLRPNFTDYSCRFEFGILPLSISSDNSLQGLACLSKCAQNRHCVDCAQL